MKNLNTQNTLNSKTFFNSTGSLNLFAADFLKLNLYKGENKMQNKIYNHRIPKTFFVFVIFLITVLSAQSQTMLKHYDLFCGSTGQNYGRAIIDRIDNGYAIAGYDYHNPSCIGSYDWMFIKLKPNGNVDCSRILGLTHDDKCFSLIQSTSDSGYVLAGYTSNNLSPFKKKATITKVDKNCNLLYSRCINDTNNSSYNQIIRDPANTWGLTGYEDHHVTSGYIRNKIVLSQYSSFGALTMSYKYISPGLSNDEAQSICFQPVGGCYGVAARTNFYSGATGVNDILVIKFDYFGNIIWRKVYKFVLPAAAFYPNSEPRKIIPMSDGGFVVVGFTNAYGSTQRDIVVLRVNSAGGVVWSSTYGATGLFEQGESIVYDGTNLVVTGSERVSSPPGPPNAFILKIPVTGGAALFTRIWDNSNPTDVGFDLVNTVTGGVAGYAVTGHTQRGVLLNDAFLWRTNTGGMIPGTSCNDSLVTPRIVNTHKLDSFQFTRVMLNDITRPCNQMMPVETTTTLCVPFDSPEGSNENDNYDGEIKNSLNQNSPNPFNPTTTINFSITAPAFTTIKVYDLSGRMVSILLNEYQDAGRHKVTFDGSNLSSGVYYYKIESGSFTDIRKMILIK